MTDAKPSTLPPKITQGRSPAYPYIPLGKAIERLQKVVDAGIGRNAYPPETFYQIWELAAVSSGARQTMAALNHFGLVDYDGRGDVRRVKLSELGLKIALDKVPGSKERSQSLQIAALTPPIHSDLYQRYGAHLPADVVLATYLTRDRGYNSAAANSLIGEYRDTLEFASLDKPDVGGIDADARDQPLPSPAKVGDMVMIEVNGTLLFAEPKRVEEVRDHDGEAWVFVEGEKSAVKLEQAIVQPTATPVRQATPPVRTLVEPEVDAPPSGWEEERLIDDGGEEIKIRYRGKPTLERYKFIRDYLEFKISRLLPK